MSAMREQELYDKYLSGKHWYSHPLEYAAEYAEFLRSRGFEGLLVDLGCGSGRDVHQFAQYGLDVIGVDLSESEVSNAKQNYPDSRFRVQNIENMDFGDGAVAAFYMINVVHYLNRDAAVKEIYRCLKEGGYLYIHFNLLIQDAEGNIDYQDSEVAILEQLSYFSIVKHRIFERKDFEPFPHEHQVLCLVLEKEQDGLF